MHLEKVKKIEFHGELDKIINTLTPIYTDGTKELCVMIMMAVPVLLIFLLSMLGAGLALTLVVPSLIFLTMYKVVRKFFGGWHHLPASVRQFYLENKEEWDDLSNRVSGMNGLLALQERNYKLLPPAKQYDDTNVADYMEERCKLLQEEADNFIARFRAAVSEDLRRVERQNNTDPKYLLQAFKDKAWQLLRLEQSLLNMPDDNSNPSEYLLFTTAVKLRRELEQEREELEAIGISQKALWKALPPRKKQPLQLKAK